MTDKVELSDATIAKLAKAMGGARATGGADTGPSSKSLENFNSILTKLPVPIAAVLTPFEQLRQAIAVSIGSWQDLSKNGIGFSGDIVAMQSAAKGARISIDEFNGILKENKVALAGWGGSIDKGAREFAALSKKMFDESQGATDGLRMLGYTNKDLNEVLALQTAAIGSSMRAGEEKDKKAIESAAELATEMDLMAKLTGKSRDEQMESMKKQQADQAYQAKLDLETRNMSEEEAAEYRSKMLLEYNKAEAQGLGQVFKEQFLYGTVATKEAAMQLAASGKAGIAVTEQAEAAKRGEFEKAAAKSKEAQEETIKMGKDTAQLQLRVISGLTGDFGKATKNFADSTVVMRSGVEALRKELEAATGKPVSTEEATAEYKKRAKKEQDDTKDATKGAAAATQAVLNFDQRIKDADSALQHALIQPLMEKVSPSLKIFNDGLLSAANNAKQGRGGMAAEAIKAGEKAGKEGFKDAAEGKPLSETIANNPLAAPVSALAKASDKFNDAVKIFANSRSTTPAQQPGSRDGGTLEKTGSPIEPMDALVKIHKDETVLDPDSTKKLAKQLSDSSKVDIKGIKGGIDGAMSNMTKAAGSANPGIDLNKILTDIKTTVSKVEVINWPKEIKDIGKAAPVQTQPAPAAPAAKVEPKKEEAKVEPKKAEAKKAADDEAAIAREDLASLEAARAKNQKVSNDIKDVVPANEFDGLNEAIGEQILKNMDLGSKYSEQVSTDINKNVPSIGATDGEMKSVEAQDNIDKAIARQKEAQQKLNDLLMGASEEDIGEQYELYAQQLDEANQNLAKVVDESMGDLIGTVEDSGTDFSDSLTQVSEDINEFSGVDEAIGGQILENMDLGPKYSEQVSDDIDSSVPSTGATDAEMKATEAQDNIDKAIARQKEAQQKLNDLLMGASEEDIGEQYELYAQQLSAANENLANVVDESFGDLIGGLTESGSDFSDNAEKVMSDINDAIPGPTEAEMKLSAARDNVERAIEKQKEAEEKLASLSVDDDDFLDQYEMAAEALREANENVAKAMDESIKAYEETVADAGEGFNDSLTQVSNDINDALPDEFGGVDEAIGGQMLENMDLGPKYSEQASNDPDAVERDDAAALAETRAKNEKEKMSKVSFGTITGIGPNGMPIMAASKKDDKALPKVKGKEDTSSDDAETAKIKRQAEAKKAEEDKKKEGGKSSETKTLDDVVKTLEKLNTAMERLVAVNSSNSNLMKDQIKATKTSGSKNLYEAHL